MRDPFVAVDTSTDLRSYARRLRRSWERSRGGDEPAAGVRPLIEASWERTRRAGIDPDRPDPMRAFDRDALADQRAASGLTDCIDALRSCLGGFAHGTNVDHGQQHEGFAPIAERLHRLQRRH